MHLVKTEFNILNLFGKMDKWRNGKTRKSRNLKYLVIDISSNYSKDLKSCIVIDVLVRIQSYPLWGISVVVAQCKIEKYILKKIYAAKI